MKLKLKEWLLTVGAFTFFFYLYALFSYLGLKDFIEEGALKNYFRSNAWHLEIVFTSVLFGTLFIFINRLTEKKVIRKRSFAFNILLRSALYILALLIVGMVIFKVFETFGLLERELLEETRNKFLSFRLIASFLVYWGFFILLFNSIITISQRFGSRTFIDLLTGKYYHPKTEELMFLFLDLKDSTRIAEKLGHKNYSQFIKECVHELTPVVQKYKARIYQYVGDEVILYWNLNEGIKELNCIHLFLDYCSILKQRNAYFLSKYGEVPSYKAGMDAGIVTLTEIGDIKREIAFHGDVLNTAARLEKKCNEFNTDMIISQHVLDHFNGDNNFQFHLLSDLPLRGKTERVKFYSVSIK
ncbi:adenylate/guanylate cyclase domain-containing protein [Carboxylicivirga sp. A043]|uniref:adenylate/guanylate cyclase domain-containing protein n=1 Tax=Carboxylicivirga litoralis TaxID=2816963 RepID=UPI0021CB1590|nr:adenylate/guanylate cyclase domain-containing protein [Carboxylicivirga sp. A043]MCU4156910.1 adenylate/guanylate cyclase domain-containing protein [Carboxylicivirga sp. A043]